jgi:hypothetical protein
MPYTKKLIEVALPLEAINAEMAREKSIRHGHPSTLHLWWARRPLAAFANHVLPYRGYGSGIIRSLACYPDIDFLDDRDGNLFKVTLKRGW